MATHEPAEDRLRRQLDSIRAQGRRRWICLISDDASSPEALAGLQRAVDGDERFVVSRSDERLGFLANFERAIGMIPPEAELIALADQDDRWFPDKLEGLLATLGQNPAAALAYSDMRILDGDGRVLSGTYWYLRRNRFDDIASLMVANVVTGAASLFRRELLADALPFPPARPGHALYHDHWLALCALATAEIAYLDRPTHDYFRYDDSITVREAPNWLRPESGVAGRLRLHWGRLTRRIRMGSASPGWEAIYLDRWLTIRQLTTILELRLGDRIQPPKRRALKRLLSAESSPIGSAWLLVRCLRPLIGRNETLARERVLLGALIWRRRGRRRRRGA
ncbi:MAG: glycosyltransferase [Solirubrobacterales bacterium]|nr:glycosyltransferase [Solirubrobacterales bacterium]